MEVAGNIYGSCRKYLWKLQEIFAGSKIILNFATEIFRVDTTTNQASIPKWMPVHFF